MYIQRYMAHFPAGGEVVLFDRSWYNRAGVERVMGFTPEDQVKRFLRYVPPVERTMIESGIILVKYWLEVSQENQTKRFEERIEDYKKIWKRSPMDLESHRRWYDYSRARDEDVQGERHVVGALVRGEVRRQAARAAQHHQSPAHEIKRLIYDPARGGVGILENYETEARHKDGSMVPIWLSARLLHEDAREVGIVGFFRDLRERRRLETELLRSERLTTLGKMVAHISHEIKNPLITIGGFAGQLGRLPDLPENARRKLTIIHQEVQRLEKFLTDMSTFTRGAPPQKTEGDLLALIREVPELMDSSFKERGVAFHLHAQGRIPSFAFDSGQNRQVLINLFKNSLEAMSEGGDLTVRDCRVFVKTLGGLEPVDVILRPPAAP